MSEDYAFPRRILDLRRDRRRDGKDQDRYRGTEPVHAPLRVDGDGICRPRPILGRGAGVKLWIEDPLGIPFARPVIAMRETVEICRALFRGEELSRRRARVQIARFCSNRAI